MGAAAGVREPNAGLKQFASPSELWAGTWRRSFILLAAGLLPFAILGRWSVVAGFALGTGLLLGDIYLLKVMLDLLLVRAGRRKRPGVLLFGLAHLVVVGAGLYGLVLLSKVGVAHMLGIFLGVTLPPAALTSLLLTGRVTKWKV